MNLNQEFHSFGKQPQIALAVLFGESLVNALEEPSWTSQKLEICACQATRATTEIITDSKSLHLGPTYNRELAF